MNPQQKANTTYKPTQGVGGEDQLNFRLAKSTLYITKQEALNCKIFQRKNT